MARQDVLVDEDRLEEHRAGPAVVVVEDSNASGGDDDWFATWTSAAPTGFVLHELLGRPRVRNDDGSWGGYGSLVGAPIE